MISENRDFQVDFLSKRNLLTTNYNEVIIDNAYKVIDNSY